MRVTATASVLARCRGTFGSGGAFEPILHEFDDAADTVAWMRSEPWVRLPVRAHRFATMGGSYLGFTPWALLMDPPPELVTAAISVGPHDHAAVYQRGAFNLVDFLGWSNQVGRQEEGGTVRRLLNQAPTARNVARAVDGLPLADAGEAQLDGRAPWYRDWVSRRDPSDPMWAQTVLDEALDRVEVPRLAPDGMAGHLPPPDDAAV